jgi:hypothetical protein
MKVPGQVLCRRFVAQLALKVTFVPEAKERVHVVVLASYAASAVGSPRGRSRIGARLLIGFFPAVCQPPLAM